MHIKCIKQNNPPVIIKLFNIQVFTCFCVVLSRYKLKNFTTIKPDRVRRPTYTSVFSIIISQCFHKFDQRRIAIAFNFLDVQNALITGR